MGALEFASVLRELRACTEARLWAEGKSLEEVWQQCERGDWLLWFCGMMAGREGWPTRQHVVLAACACAETTLKNVPEGEGRPQKAIETARRWACGQATEAEVKACADDAAAAYAESGYAASYAPASFAIAAAAYDAGYAAYAAADTAEYAARAAANAADKSRRELWHSTHQASLKESADLVRSLLPVPTATVKQNKWPSAA